MQARPGQKVNLTLFSFSSLQNYHIVQHSAVCPYYAIIKVRTAAFTRVQVVPKC